MNLKSRPENIHYRVFRKEFIPIRSSRQKKWNDKRLTQELYFWDFIPQNTRIQRYYTTVFSRRRLGID